VRTQTASFPEYLRIDIDKVGKLLYAGKLKNYTKNEFEAQKDGKVIYDKATGLMWQQSGSEKVTYEEARNYIRKLNQDGFAGYKDWRLPTLEEAPTLLKPEKTENNLYIDPLFDNKQKCIWTSYLSSASGAWVVDFNRGICYYYSDINNAYVRAVR
jgi:uncharacterized protein DUF1566